MNYRSPAEILASSVVFLALGAAYALICDVIHALVTLGKLQRKRRGIYAFLSDFLFTVCLSILFTVALFYRSDGTFRGIYFLAAFDGLALYKLTLSRAIIGFISKIIAFFVRHIEKAARIMYNRLKKKNNN